MEPVVLYHNPRCSKSRAALALLEERGVPVRIVRYLEEPLSRAALADLAAKLGLPARSFVRTGEASYAAAGLGPASPDAAILDAIAAAPILLERPIAARGSKAVVGRPPERVLELLG
ncbi:MAG TPA: arsenate reductase (glutaredoxin) [Myxococcota bacterium]|nr:arsenate reductase (glutaredoxin) [Myxococcota bacterium]